MISPTSTLMKEGGLTADEVAGVLGLPGGVDPLNFLTHLINICFQ